MSASRISRQDVIDLLRSEGFTCKNGREAEVFENATTGAEVILSAQKPSSVANRYELQLVRRTLVDFGHLSEGEFARWVADPKHFQAA